jgi:putative flippase GtrA
VAVTVAYALSFGVNFTLNRVWVFKADGDPAGQAGRYTALCLANYLATLALVTGLTAVGTHYLAAKAVATGSLAVVNYLACKAWVFSAGS